MHAVSVSGLTHNSAEALRHAKAGPVVVLNRDHPDVTRFISHRARLGIPAIRLTAAESNADLDTLEQWLQSSSPMPAH